VSGLLSHSPKIIEFYLSIQILQTKNVSWLHFSWATLYITHHNAVHGTKTRLSCFALIGCTLFNWVSCIADRRRQSSCVGKGAYSDATQLNSMSSWVELSCVAINGLLRRLLFEWNGVSRRSRSLLQPSVSGVAVSLLVWGLTMDILNTFCDEMHSCKYKCKCKII